MSGHLAEKESHHCRELVVNKHREENMELIDMSLDLEMLILLYNHDEARTQG
jgi:hypothetical protein